MIYEYAGQLVSDCFGKHNSCYGGIDSAGQCAEDFSVAYFFADSFDGFFYEGVHVPVAGAAADIVYKVGKHFLSFFGVQNFWMELGCIEVFLYVCNGCYRTVIRMGDDFESRSYFGDVVVVAHPADGFFGYVLKQCGTGIYSYLNFSIFSDRCYFYFSAEQMHHQL